MPLVKITRFLHCLLATDNHLLASDHAGVTTTQGTHSFSVYEVSGTIYEPYAKGSERNIIRLPQMNCGLRTDTFR